MSYLLSALLFVVLQSFFSGMETGMVSLRKSRVAHGVREGVFSARILMYFVERPETMLSTMLVGTNICVVCAASMSARAAASFGYGGSAGIAVSTLGLTLLLLAAEIIPKDWFRQDPYGRCLMFAYPLAFSYGALFIPVRAMAALTSVLTRVFSGGREERGAAALLREDFRTLIRESESGGELDSESAEILDRSLDFHSSRAGDLMTPVSEVVDIRADATVEEALSLCGKRGVSRLPVRGAKAEKGDWRGVFSLYDVIFELPESKWGGERVGDYLRALPMVSEDAGMEALLSAVSASGNPMLAVSGKGGGPAVGIVTMGTVARTLFGDVREKAGGRKEA